MTQFKDLEKKKIGENLHYIFIRGNLKSLSEILYLFIISYP